MEICFYFRGPTSCYSSEDSLPDSPYSSQSLDTRSYPDPGKIRNSNPVGCKLVIIFSKSVFRLFSCFNQIKVSMGTHLNLVGLKPLLALTEVSCNEEKCFF